MRIGGNFSLSSDLIGAVFTGAGLLARADGKRMRFLITEPLAASSCELGFRGPLADGFFERLKEGISKLPSFYEAQIILNRNLGPKGNPEELFPAIGLETHIVLLETDLPNGTTTLKQTFEDLGFEFRSGSKAEYSKLISKFFGQNAYSTDLILPDMAWEEDYLRSGRSFLKAASLTDLPLTTWNNCFQSLAETADEFLVSIKVRVPDKGKSRKELETKRRVSHALSARKPHELSDLESGSNVTASEEVLMRVTQGKEALLFMSLAVFMADDDLRRLETRMQDLVSDSNGATGAGIFVEGVGTLPILRSHLPGTRTEPARDLQILSGNLAHIIPIFMDYGRQQDPASLNFVSRCGEKSHLNLFSKTNLNFNSFVCGASGSGKSFLMNSLLAGFKENNPNGSIAIFDVGGSYRKLISRFGGTSLDLTPESATELIATALKRMTFQASGFCKTLVENICGAGPHITHSHRVAIEDLLQACSGAPFRITTLSNEAAEKSEKVYEDIRLWLRPYLHWDLINAGFNADKVLNEKVRSFDFKNLDGDPVLQRLAILILTQGIWDRLKGKDAEKTIIVFDEVWKFFSQAAGFLEEMYRTFRKYGAGIASVTQNLSDYGNDAFAKLVITNSFNRVLLQGAASSEILVKSLDLNESDIKRFLSIASKKNEYSEFWFGTPKYSQILRLYPSKQLFQLANSEDIQKEMTP